MGDAYPQLKKLRMVFYEYDRRSDSNSTAVGKTEEMGRNCVDVGVQVVPSKIFLLCRMWQNYADTPPKSLTFY